MVTGAASGIGLATACRFAKEGARVFIVDYNAEALEKTRGAHPEFSGFSAADVSKEEDVAAAFRQMDRELGGVDVLISNAGISVRNDVLDVPYSQWNRTMDINLGGMFLCAREAGRRMKEQGGRRHPDDGLHQRHGGAPLVRGLQRLEGRRHPVDQDDGA